MSVSHGPVSGESSLQLLVEHVLPERVVGLETAQARDVAGKFPDGRHLLLQKLVLQHVRQLEGGRKRQTDKQTE